MRSTRWRHMALGVLVTSIVLPHAAPAYAQKADKKIEEARQLYESGITHYNLGEYEEAIRDFKAAYALSSAPGLLFNIAQAYRLWKKYELAAQFYKNYLRLEEDAPNRADVEARIAEMEKLLAEEKKLEGARPHGTIDPDKAAPREKPEPEANPTPTTPPAPDKKVAEASPPHDAGGSAVSGAGTDLVAQSERGGGLAGMVRLDVTPTEGGMAAVIGASYDLGSSFDITAAAILGAGQQGAWLGGTLYLGKSAWRPLLILGAPMFFVGTGGFRVGGQGGAGLAWAATAKLSLALCFTVAYFPSVPVGYDKTVLLPTVGASWRL